MQKIATLIYLLISISLIALISSFFIPKFTDGIKIDELEEQWKNQKLNEQQYIANYRDLTTIKYEVQNISLGLLTFFIVLLAFLKDRRSAKFNNFISIVSIKKTTLYYLLINIGLILFISGNIETIIKQDKQYPIYDDSFHALFGLFYLSLVLIPLTNLIYTLFIIQSRRQNSIFNFEIKSVKQFVNGIILMLISLIVFCNMLLFIYLGSIMGTVSSQILLYITISLNSEINYKTANRELGMPDSL